jgi:AcrR family transcriptional regulator
VASDDSASVAKRRERARLTRAVIVEASAGEFARCGYGAASLNTILASVSSTKGAMYFHSTSKADLAHAVVDLAASRYREIGQRWSQSAAAPLDALAGLVGDLADAFTSESALQAEARLALEPDLRIDAAEVGAQAWEDAAVDLATRAAVDGGLDPRKLVSTLAVLLAGHRYLAASGDYAAGGSLRGRFAESLEIVLAAVTADLSPP